VRNELVDTLVQIAREKDVPPEAMAEIIAQALATAYRKNFPGETPDIVVHVDPALTSIRACRRMTVVDDEIMDTDEILLEDARKICPTCQPGDTVEVELQAPVLARIAAQTAKQVLMQKLKELERERIYEEYKGRQGEVLAGQVVRREHGSVVVNIGRADGLLPPNEQVRGENYRPSDRIKVYLKSVEKDNRGPRIVLSRSSTNLIRGLFELEVPEIADGIVTIKAVAREAGARSKIAVVSKDPRVDPVGSCVGQRGSRVQAVVNELRGEKIDIIRWSSDPAEFIAEALSPAKVTEVRLMPAGTEKSQDKPTALVIVPDSQLSLAIGKSGQNVRLAAHLTNWHIDIRAESQMAQAQTADVQEAPSKVSP